MKIKNKNMYVTGSSKSREFKMLTLEEGEKVKICTCQSYWLNLSNIQKLICNILIHMTIYIIIWKKSVKRTY